MDILDDLNSGQSENAEATPVAPAAADEAAATATDQPTENADETAAQKEARERDEKGRFKAKQPDEPIMVPLKALHETRDEVRALRSQLEALQPQAQPQVQQVPDIFENPEGYAAFLQSQIQSVTLNERLNTSEELVRQTAGDETVNAAQEWGRQMLASNPAFAQAFYQQRNPYGFLVKEHQRFQTVSQLGDDPDQIKAFLAWKSAQGQVSQGEQPVSQQQSAPPPSIASATSAGGVQHVASGPTVAFDNFFTR